MECSSSHSEPLKQGSLQEGYEPLTHNESAMHLFENKCFRAGIIHFVKCLLSRLLWSSYDHIESKEKWAGGLFSYTHQTTVFTCTQTQSAPAEEKWCEQEASICRPRGVHRPQGELEERKKKKEESVILIDAKCAPTGSIQTISTERGSMRLQMTVLKELTPSSWGST